MTGWWVVVALLAGCGRVAFAPVVTDAATDAPARIACGTEPSLVACYAFEGDALDSSGRNNHGIGQLSYGPGQFGEAATFGLGVDVTVAEAPSLDVTRVTVMAWVRLDALPIEMRSVVFDRNQGFAFFVRGTGDVGIGVSTTGLGGGANAPDPLSLGVWTHIAGTYDGSSSDVYVDGVLVDRTTGLSGDITTVDTTGSRIGANAGDSTSMEDQFWVGAIDELGIWSEALPPARIMAAAQE